MDKRKSAPVEREQTTLRLPSELKEELQREACNRGQSLNEYAIHVLERRKKP